MDFAGDRLNHPEQRSIHVRTAFAAYGRGVNLVDESTFSIWNDNYHGLMRNSLYRFVIEIYVVRRNEDERQDDRNHHVIVEAATLVCPEDVAANCAPNAGQL
jgi:hypothetical protein